MQSITLTRTLLPFLAILTAVLIFVFGAEGTEAGEVVKPVIESTHDKNATRIILLGTAGGPPTRTDRSEPATLLVVHGVPYLVDAGAGVVQRLAQAGFKASDINRVFLTHLHLDHQAGLEPFISTGWFNGNLRNFNQYGAKKDTPEVSIYGPPSTEFLVDASLDYLSISERIFQSGSAWLTPAKDIYRGHDVEPGVVYDDGLVKVTAVENTHYHFEGVGREGTTHDKSYSYRFDTPEGAVVFTGDTGPSEATTKLAKDARVLISEVVDLEILEKRWNKQYHKPMSDQTRFHMSQEHLIPEEVGKMAQKARVGLVILHHFVPIDASDTDATVFTAGVAEEFDGPVIPGRDLMEYDIYKNDNSNK